METGLLFSLDILNVSEIAKTNRHTEKTEQSRQARTKQKQHTVISMNNVDGRTNEATHNTEELQLKNTDKTKQSRLTDKHEQPAILSNRCNKKHEHTYMNTDITMPKITHNLCQQDKAKYNTTCTNRDMTDKPQHNKYEQTNNIHTHTHTHYI